MTRTFAASMAGFVLASALVAAQTPQPAGAPQSEPRQTPPATAAPQRPAAAASGDVTLSGCLVPGSAAGVFILDSARSSAAGTSGPAQRYVLMATGEDVDLAKNVNKRVTISGAPSAMSSASGAASGGAAGAGSTPATPSSSGSGAAAAGQSGARSSDANLPRFTAKSITATGDSCTASTTN